MDESVSIDEHGMSFSNIHTSPSVLEIHLDTNPEVTVQLIFHFILMAFLQNNSLAFVLLLS